MKIRKIIDCSILAILVSAVFLNCSDPYHLQTPATQPVGYVSIPKFGSIEAKNVISLQPGTHPMLTTDGHLYVVSNSNGSILRSVAQFSRSRTKTTASNNLRTPYFDPITDITHLHGYGPYDPPTYTNGLAGAYATSISDLQTFMTNYTVPPAPSTTSGVIYIGNVMGGLESTSDDATQSFIGPVLQWGNNGSFGGSYWTMANWYVYTDLTVIGEDDDGVPVPGYTTYAFYANNVTLTPGTTVACSVTNGGVQPGYNSEVYYSKFQYPGGQPQIATVEEGGTMSLNNPVPVLDEVWIFLEGYQSTETEKFLTSTSELPPNYMPISGISVGNSAGPVSLTWSTYNDTGLGSQTQKGQQNAVVLNSNTAGSGEVDLWFVACPSYPVTGMNWTNSTKTLSWNPVYGATGYTVIITGGPNGGGFGLSTSTPSIPNFFNAYRMSNTQGTYQVSIQPVYACGTGTGTAFSFYNCPSNLTAPTGGSWNNSSLTLSWNTVSGATGYSVVITGGPDGGGFGLSTTTNSVPNFFNAFEISNLSGTYTVNINATYTCGSGPAYSYSFTH